jgi:two-component system, cell cycle response regulator DivK
MSGTVLVADDNERNRKLLRVILDSSGYGVAEVGDGAAAVEAAARIRPDLVLMDFRMPSMDGVEATRRIKADPETAAIPVFIVTSSAMAGDRERILAESGCDAIFTKPIDYKEVLESVRRAIGGP